MIRILFTAIFTLLFLSNNAIAQPTGGHREGTKGSRPSFEGSIIGHVVDKISNNGVPYSTISVYKLRDSVLVDGTISDEHGFFKLNISGGAYSLKIESIGYNDLDVPKIIITPKQAELDAGDLLIEPLAINLEEVEVNAEKSRMTIGLDKKVFEVGKDLSSIGGSGEDILQNIPSVTLDVDGNVSLRGSQNVRILIDGKPSSLTGISSSDVLLSLPASSIEKVEIITNPSAKYEAEGMAGIINIILKKDRKKGLNGLLNLSAAWPQDHSAGFNLNYGTGKWNFYTNYSAQYRDIPGQANHHREVTFTDTFYVQDQLTSFQRYGFSHFLTLGSEYAINPRNTINASVVLNARQPDHDVETKYFDYNSIGDLSSYRNRTLTDTGLNKSIDFNIYYLKKFAAHGRQLTANIRYSSGIDNSNSSILEQSFLADQVTSDGQPDIRQKSSEDQAEHSYDMQLDYDHPFGEKGMFSAGLRSSYNQINKIYVTSNFNDSSMQWEVLSNVSNHFIFNQYVNAAYATYGNKKGLWSYQLGLRAEQTILSTQLIETNELNKRSYLNLFPSAHLNFDLSKGNQLQLSYSRRIHRPNLHMLNPFRSYADPLNLWSGNPNLNPEFSHSLEMGYLKFGNWGSINTSIYYRHSTDVIQFFRNILPNGVSESGPVNMSSSDNYGAELIANLNPTTWWRVMGSFNYFRRMVDAGNLGSQYASDDYSWNSRLSNTFYFWNKTMLQIMANYRAPANSVQGMRNAMYFVDIALKKDILNKNGSISFRLADVLNSRKYDIDIQDAAYFIHTTYQRAGRRTYISFSYKFNNYKQDKRQQQGGGMEDMGY